MRVRALISLVTTTAMPFNNFSFQQTYYYWHCLSITCFCSFLRFERLGLQTAAGKAKVLGTITGIGGAMLLTFLKGVEINIWTFHINLLHKKGHTGTPSGGSGSKLLGIFCGLGSCFCFALWLIIQVRSRHFEILVILSIHAHVNLGLICGFYCHWLLCNTGKDEQRIPKLSLKYSLDVLNGGNTSHRFCPLCWEGLEPMEVGLEYKASDCSIFGMQIT